MLSKFLRIIDTGNSFSLQELMSIVGDKSFEEFNRLAVSSNYSNDDYYIANLENRQFGILKNDHVYILYPERVKRVRASNYTIVSVIKISDCDLFGSESLRELSDALDGTPIGRKTKEDLMLACNEEYLIDGKKCRLAIKIHTSSNLANAVTKERFLNKDKLRIDLYLDSGKRTKNWSNEEKLLIFTVHEHSHLIFKNGKITTDGVAGNWTEGHDLHMAKEFKARLEYSLLYPMKSDPKENWIFNYLWWFDIYESLVKGDDLPDEITKAKEDRGNEYKDEKYAVCYDGLEEFRKYIDDNYPADSSDDFNDTTYYPKGITIAQSIYRDLIESWTDSDAASFKRVKGILDDKNTYLDDSNFTKIP